MSLENFSKALYQDLPSQNLGFVEGGVLVYPSMIGLALPTDLQDRDLYIYLKMYVKVMDELSKAQNEEEGKDSLKRAAKVLDVPEEKFMKETGYPYMLECVISKQVIPTSFENIQRIFSSQRDRANLLLEEMQDQVDETAKDVGKKLTEKFTAMPKTVTEPEVVEPVSQPPNPIQVQPPTLVDYSESNQTALGQLGSTDEVGMLDKVKEYATKPPVLIGGVVLSYLLLNKFVLSPKEKTRKENKRKVRKRRNRRSKDGWKS